MRLPATSFFCRIDASRPFLKRKGASDSTLPLPIPFDVLVLLDGPIDYGPDLRTNINALYDLVLALERPISAKPVDIAAYETAAYPLYRNAKAEGVLA